MQQLQIRLAIPEEKAAILSFMDLYWGEPHPLLHRQDLFSFYYRTEQGINFALALTPTAGCPAQPEDILAVCGYIPANRQGTAIWLSLLQANPKAKGAGMMLVDNMGGLTGAKTVCCNNIRQATLPVYHFLGYTAECMDHYYRLKKLSENEKQTECGNAFHLAVISRYLLPAIDRKARFEPVTLPQLEKEFVFPDHQNPEKDIWYLKRRYGDFSRLIEGGYRYLLYGLRRSEKIMALLVVRKNETPRGTALRIVDYLGTDSDFALVGGTVDALIRQFDAEYADMYCAGLAAEAVKAAGFVLRTGQDGNIIPNYLNPPLQQNIDFYYFTSDSTNFTMFRADGDQDRPNLGC